MIGRTGLYPPDFLILGAQKCGTTSLSEALRGHPEIQMARFEARHFGFVPDAEIGGRSWGRYFADWDGRPVIGEKTPEYLSMARSAEQICRLLPEVKGIVLVRNPVDRAYSAYWHARRHGWAGDDFAAMVDAEMNRTGPVDEKRSWRNLLQRGEYAEQLQRYFDLGFDRHRMLVLPFDDLVADPRSALRTVQEFLGVDVVVTDLPRVNVAKRSVLPAPVRRAITPFHRVSLVQRILETAYRPIDIPPMDAVVRNRLVDHFRPHNQRLEAILGRSLASWDR